MTGYQTQQRHMLIAFFKAHPDRAFTIDEIAEGLRATLGHLAPSRSTIYRAVADLASEKALERSYISQRRRSAYQYRDKNACVSHLHMRCKQCNALMHLDPTVSSAIAGMLEESESVSLDISGTVLSGRCAQCGKK